MFAEGFLGLKAFFFASLKRKLFFVWFALIVFLVIASMGGGSHDVTVAVSIFVCGGSTFLFWNYRKRFYELFSFSWSPRKKFVVVGSLCAAYAEFVFWFFEKLFGAEGVAASPNLGLDLLITMPWYVLMVYLLFKVETKYYYSYFEILLLGGIYELGADGIVGQMLEGLTPAGILAVILVIPEFVIVYSIIVLPPTYLLQNERDIARTGEDDTRIYGEEDKRIHKKGNHRYWYGLLPLLGLIPFTIYVLLLLGILSALA